MERIYKVKGTPGLFLGDLERCDCGCLTVVNQVIVKSPVKGAVEVLESRPLEVIPTEDGDYKCEACNE